VPHLVRSSRRHFREPRLEGSRSLMTYDGLGRDWRREIVATYPVQIVDKISRIGLIVRYPAPTLIPVEYFAEFIVKLG